MVRRLVREEGLFGGGSAGCNLVAALRVAARGARGDGMCDSWDRYRAAENGVCPDYIPY